MASKTYKHTAGFSHGSGLYSVDRKFLRRALQYTRSLPGVSVISGTEAKGRDEWFLKNTKWQHVHMPGAKGECWLTWRDKTWELAGKATVPILSNDQYFTRGGSLFPKFRALRVPLTHKASEKQFLIYVVHMPLDNTAKRASVWVDATVGLAALLAVDRKKYPDVIQVVVGDINKNWREDGDRGQCVKHIVEPTKTRCSWTGHVPKTGGTHGNRGIIDHAYVHGAAVVACRLMKRLGLFRRASDHWPFKYKLGWNK